MKRPSYMKAIQWIALNDDIEWVYPSEDRYKGEIIPSVSAVLVADLFDVSVEQVTSDIRYFVQLRSN